MRQSSGCHGYRQTFPVRVAHQSDHTFGIRSLPKQFPEPLQGFFHLGYLQASKSIRPAEARPFQAPTLHLTDPQFLKIMVLGTHPINGHPSVFRAGGLHGTSQRQGAQHFVQPIRRPSQPIGLMGRGNRHAVFFGQKIHPSAARVDTGRDVLFFESLPKYRSLL